MPVAVLAKRIRGFRLAWHSFTPEECEVSGKEGCTRHAIHDPRVNHDAFTFEFW